MRLRDTHISVSKRSGVHGHGTTRLKCQGLIPDPVEHPGAKSLNLTQEPLHAPSSFCPPVVHMSRNQSRTKGSTWILRRFAVLLLGSSSTSAEAGVGEGGAQAVLVWAISSCVSGRLMVSPGRHQSGRSERTPRGSSWWWGDVPLRSTFPQLVRRTAAATSDNPK